VIALSPLPLILGHRGAPQVSLENTLRSFSLAVEQGADGVELDIQRANDGVPVVIHDDTLNRTMGVHGRVSALAWPALQRLSGARLPSFEQVVAWAAASGAWVNVELKAGDVEKEVSRLIRSTGIEKRVVISSFDVEVVRCFGEVDPELPRFFLSEHWDTQTIDAVKITGANGVCLKDAAADQRVIEDIRERDLALIVWTVNQPSRLRELLLENVAGIITDYPAIGAEEREALFPA
jgi:glycerophosphoryl diester phosphodiesterase